MEQNQNYSAYEPLIQHVKSATGPEKKKMRVPLILAFVGTIKVMWNQYRGRQLNIANEDQFSDLVRMFTETKGIREIRGFIESELQFQVNFNPVFEDGRDDLVIAYDDLLSNKIELNRGTKGRCWIRFVVSGVQLDVQLNGDGFESISKDRMLEIFEICTKSVKSMRPEDIEVRHLQLKNNTSELYAISEDGSYVLRQNPNNTQNPIAEQTTQHQPTTQNSTNESEYAVQQSNANSLEPQTILGSQYGNTSDESSLMASDDFDS